MTVPFEAFTRASAAPGDFVGVILSAPMERGPGDRGPAVHLPSAWHVETFRSAAAMFDWFSDWHGNPGSYLYLAAFDKTKPSWRDGLPLSAATSPGAAPYPTPRGPLPVRPVNDDNTAPSGVLDTISWMLSNAYDGIAASVSGDAGREKVMTTPLTPIAKLHALDKIIALHEAFWGQLAQERPSGELRTFLRDRWDPFFAQWIQTFRGLGAYLDVPEFVLDIVGDNARALSQLRQLAAADFYLPTPDLGTSRHGVVNANAPANVSGPHGGGGHAPPAGHHGGGGGYAGFGGWGGGRWGAPWYPYPYYVYEVPEAIYEVPVIYCEPGDPSCDPSAMGEIDGPAAPAFVVSGDVEVTIRHAGERLAGLACSGWLDSVTSAVSSAVHGVTSVASSAVGTIGHTLGQLKGPIAAAASMAAAGAAAAIPGAGPLVAPLAGSLAKNLVDAATGGADVAAASQKVIAQAAQAATQSPQIAAALGTAQKAVSQATAGYHVVQTVANAAAGNPDAQAQVAELHQAAASGDPGALSLVAVAQQVASPMQNDASPGITRDPNWQVRPDWIEIDAPAAASGRARVGAATPRQQASAAAKEYPASVVGIVQLADGSWSLQAFATSDDADDWFGQWLGLPHAFRYVAYYDRRDATFPGPLNEAQGAPIGARVASSGVLLPLFAALGGAAAGYYGPSAYHWGRAQWDARKAHKAASAG